MKKLLSALLKNKRVDYYRKKFAVTRWHINPKHVKNSLNPKRILIASNLGGNINTLALDITLAKALESRGHKVDITLCDGGFRGCMYAEANKFKNIKDFLDSGNKTYCYHCNLIGKKTLAKFNVNTIPVANKARDFQNFTTSETGISGAKRFLAVSNLDSDESTSEILRRFNQSSLMYQMEFTEILKRHKYDTVIAHHGIYVPQGDILNAAKEAGITLFTWVQAYRKSSYIFAKNDTYHKTLLTDDGWDRPLTASEREVTLEYLDSRDTGQNDWIRFGLTTRNFYPENHFSVRQTGKTYLLLTNVSWDAQLHYESNTFENMFQWLESTITYFVKNRDANLIIRIHPAEVTGAIKSNEPVSKWISNNFPQLPENIVIINPEAEVSTYSIMRQADVGLIYASKSGLEMLAMGKPVVVAGEAWIKNKGICLEPKNEIEYLKMIQDLKENNIKPDLERVLQYAHYFFFRRTIEIKSIQSLKHFPYGQPRLSPDWEKLDPNLFCVIKSIENDEIPQLK